MYQFKHQNDFAILITCYKDTSVLTLQTLKDLKYTGKYRIIVGTDDPMLEEFKQKYGDAVYVFDKEQIAKEFNIDSMNCDGDRTMKVILYARHACNKCAREMGLEYFSQMDDDYKEARIRYVEGKILKSAMINCDYEDIDHIYERAIDLMIDILETNPHMSCVSFAQGGDFIGGAESWYRIQGKRKVMNTMIYKMNNLGAPFRGNLNEDVNYYVDNGRLGNICLTHAGIMITQATTQNRKVGGVEAYAQYGTYFKSFFTVMCNPSACKIGILVSNTNVHNNRIHHSIDWNKTCPKIISSDYKIK